MAQISGKSGATKDLIGKLRQKGIYFDSLESILDFRANWRILIKKKLDEEKEKLTKEIKRQELFLEDLTTEYN